MWIIYTKTLILVVKGLHPLRSFPWKWRKDDPLGKSSTLNSNNLGDRTVSRHINPCFINFFDKIFWKLFRKYIIWFIKLDKIRHHYTSMHDVVLLSTCDITSIVIVACWLIGHCDNFYTTSQTSRMIYMIYFRIHLYIFIKKIRKKRLYKK